MQQQPNDQPKADPAASFAFEQFAGQRRQQPPTYLSSSYGPAQLDNARQPPQPLQQRQAWGAEPSDVRALERAGGQDQKQGQDQGGARAWTPPVKDPRFVIPPGGGLGLRPGQLLSQSSTAGLATKALAEPAPKLMAHATLPPSKGRLFNDDAARKRRGFI